MKRLSNKINIYFAALILLLGVGSCETTELELVDDPNALNSATASPDFYVNAIQISLRNLFGGDELDSNGTSLSERGMEVTRILHMFGPLYDNAYSPGAHDFAWSTAYAEILADARSLEPLAIEQELYMHLGIAQVAEAYAIAAMVDFFGDVPYSESADGVTFNPKADPGLETYQALHGVLDNAIANFNKEEFSKPANDFFYGGDKAKWINLANTLKLKLYLQSRLVTESESTAGINAILASGNYIQGPSGDFKFQYGTTDNNPDSRHPFFTRNFVEGTGVTDYMSNTYMDMLLNQKTAPDPRVRYYIYRQRNSNAQNTVEQSCFGALPPPHIGFASIFCNLVDNPGYWGRDHGYDFGIPPDTGARATWGLYPVGGKFDNDDFEAIPDRNIGTKGSGIDPIMMSSFVDFMLAEAALTIGVNGDPATYLESGIRESIGTVMAFRTDLVDTDFVPSEADVDAYVAEVLANYAAANNDQKLNIIIKEYWLALWGNGVEAYNTYRRTGKPDDLQQLVRQPSDNFMRSFWYPDAYVNQNSNATQKPDVFQKVFWDTNPDTGFIY
ncbi:SusD/RagB family nutrient-binding outer membrane lipoprotein [Flagellimonas pacifica]|uniref:Starch-binding associating with outer membrane n=1 Tax=Flagellimonas pacifica TaxID=1247520 RepID=A0A285MYF6_9FLAO|nr:SusD/RagB family nutrient-binding outer membrane lipoprotein [Allomuricauda parva]SNZ01577.1 Starch-binding associating with outer membrane [Allomuricauda parva]